MDLEFEEGTSKSKYDNELYYKYDWNLNDDRN